MNKLENKLAIVTGGAMGNGLGITKVFLKYGCNDKGNIERIKK